MWHYSRKMDFTQGWGLVITCITIAQSVPKFPWVITEIRLTMKTLFPTVQEMVGVRLCGMGFLFDLLDLRCDGGR